MPQAATDPQVTDSQVTDSQVTDSHYTIISADCHAGGSTSSTASTSIRSTATTSMRGGAATRTRSVICKMWSHPQLGRRSPQQ